MPMSRKPTLAGAMTPFPHSVDIKAPLDEAQEFLREHRIRHLPVTDEGVLVGVSHSMNQQVEAAPLGSHRVEQALDVRIL